MTANALTFNGTIPGPTFRLKVGDTVIVHFENDLARRPASTGTASSWPTACDGTPFTQNQVAPGGKFLYKFEVTRPGLFWYHPHHHSSTNQVFKGLYGMIVVDGSQRGRADRDRTSLPDADDTLPLVLSDITVCKTPAERRLPPTLRRLPHVGGGAASRTGGAYAGHALRGASGDRRGRQSRGRLRRR